MSSFAGGVVGYVFHDYNSPLNEDGTKTIHVSHWLYHGLWPKVGQQVEIVDPDPTAGSERGLVVRLDAHTERAYAEPIPGSYRAWEDQEASATTSSGPDWLMRAWDNRGKTWPDDFQEAKSA